MGGAHPTKLKISAKGPQPMLLPEASCEVSAMQLMTLVTLSAKTWAVSVAFSQEISFPRRPALTEGHSTSLSSRLRVV
jgi:hypothetical protein